MKRVGVLLAMLALVSAPLWAYPVEVQVNASGLDIEVQDTQLDVATVLLLRNHEQQDVRCDVEWHNGPELNRQRRVSVEAGGQRTVRFSPRRQVIRVTVIVNCRLAEEED